LSFWTTGLSQPLIETSIIADMGFWPAVADAVLRMRQQSGAEPLADLRDIDIIVPSWAHAPLLRSALHERLKSCGHSHSIPPRIHTVDTWAGEVADDTIERRVELFAALRSNDWIRSTFGEQPVALWNLAAQVAAVCDELTLAAVDGADTFEVQLHASLARHFSRRAAKAIQPQARLILQLWRAGLTDGDATTAYLAALNARTRAATRPLLYVSAQPSMPWVRAWLAGLAQRVPVHLIQADVASAVAAQPLLAAAWPELIGASAEPAPIAARARSIKALHAATAPMLVEAQNLEEEAIAVCEQVLTWLRPQGQRDLFAEQAPGSIALVALDRVAARRVRALLERAQVLVRDETGWKLSTTSAAAAVMRLFELSANGFHHRDLLDWLKSPFTLHGVVGKGFLIETIEKVIRSRGIVQGLGPIVLALHETSRDESQQDVRSHAIGWLRALEEHATRLAGTAASMATFANALDTALAELGMRAALFTDPVGKEVLRVLDDLRARATASRETGQLNVAPTEFRALIAARFEEVAVAGGAIDSPVVMVSLSAAALRDFECAVLIGVDAGHLPAVPPELLFFSSAVRADLGLPGAREAARAQAENLAGLLIRVPRVMAIWCSRADDEPRPVAAWFARLRAVARAAGLDPLRPSRTAVQQVAATLTARPAPHAPQLPRLELSATQYQSLVECPYQFYARHLLRLRELEEINEDPSPSEYGKAVHEVLARFHLKWREVDLRRASPKELAASLTEHANAVFDPLIERRPRMLAWRRQFAETQNAYLVWLRKRVAEGWSFVDAEVKATVAFDVDAGGVRTIDLVGRIDRIDVRGDEVEVLDYKTRRRQQLAEDLVLAGESIQLPFYGLLHLAPVTRASFVFLQRTSDRQEQVGLQPPRQPYPRLVEALRVRLRNDLQRIALGAPLPALGNEIVCEWCEMRGLCRRDFWHDEDSAR
jgi:ATP-dependent helicase/nuclease subunit B